ncbi:MAG: hypothetical protein ACRD0K_14740 [Egibacteraceae bacterium]
MRADTWRRATLALGTGCGRRRRRVAGRRPAVPVTVEHRSRTLEFDEPPSRVVSGTSRWSRWGSATAWWAG